MVLITNYPPVQSTKRL